MRRQLPLGQADEGTLTRARPVVIGATAAAYVFPLPWTTGGNLSVWLTQGRILV